MYVGMYLQETVHTDTGQSATTLAEDSDEWRKQPNTIMDVLGPLPECILVPEEMNGSPLEINPSIQSSHLSGSEMVMDSKGDGDGMVKDPNIEDLILPVDDSKNSSVSSPSDALFNENISQLNLVEDTDNTDNNEESFSEKNIIVDNNNLEIGTDEERNATLKKDLLVPKPEIAEEIQCPEMNVQEVPEYNPTDPTDFVKLNISGGESIKEDTKIENLEDIQTSDKEKDNFSCCKNYSEQREIQSFEPRTDSTSVDISEPLTAGPEAVNNNNAQVLLCHFNLKTIIFNLSYENTE